MERSVYVIGDIHGDFNILEARFGDVRSPFCGEKKDVLFVAGDAGFINSYESNDSKQKRIKNYCMWSLCQQHESFSSLPQFERNEQLHWCRV